MNRQVFALDVVFSNIFFKKKNNSVLVLKWVFLFCMLWRALYYVLFITTEMSS